MNKYDGTTATQQALFRLFFVNSIYRMQKQKTVIYILPSGGGSDLDTRIATLYIDTNGIDGPNAFGKDIFQFILTNGGKMIPHGLEAGDYYTTNCADNYIKDGYACAARVVRDGFKITY